MGLFIGGRTVLCAGLLCVAAQGWAARLDDVWTWFRRYSNVYIYIYVYVCVVCNPIGDGCRSLCVWSDYTTLSTPVGVWLSGLRLEQYQGMFLAHSISTIGGVVDLDEEEVLRVSVSDDHLQCTCRLRFHRDFPVAVKPGQQATYC